MFSRIHIFATFFIIKYISGYSNDDFIHIDGATHWGKWGPPDVCQNGSYAYGVQLRVEKTGLLNDDTALNAIKLFCGNKHGFTGDITSSVTDWGEWTDAVHCTNGYLNGYDLKIVENHLIGDEIAATSVLVQCTGVSGVLEPEGRNEGKWLGGTACPDNRVICGIMTEVQRDSGILIDDTAVNDVKFLCCDLIEM